ncbi:hypothetical protein ACG83_33210 [Frankia sp. R43]|nr:hypothetical protein ACG83_33210 [Frankia sp. R43]
MTRLPRQAVLRYLERLADDLTPRQSQRLRDLADLIDGDGRIPMADALEVATPGGGDVKAQDAFRKFRAAFDEAAAEAGVAVRLVSDQRKAPPRGRMCWFEGEDLAGDELAAHSRRGADRRRGDETVTGTVSEVLPPTAPEAGHGGSVIHVEVARKASDHVRRREREFVELLSEQASAIPGGYRITSLVAPLLGTDLEGERRRLRMAADLVVELDCAASRLDAHPGALTRRPLRIALEGVARGTRPTREIVHETPRPFSQQPDRGAKVAFVQRVLDLIAEVLQVPATRGGSLEPEKWARDRVGRPQLRGEPVTSQVGETSLSSDTHTDAPSRRLGEPLPAVERLVTWATEPSPGARHLCALLGDVGMGKTTTAQLFTLALLDRREHDPMVPLPILFDLRALPARVVRETAGLRKILQALLDAGDLGRVPTVDEVLDLVASGRCVLIFDGLDEVLVHLEPHAGQVFTRTLWRATEELWRAQPAQARADRPSKLLLSCRTHYFRSIRDEANHFTGQHRDGPVGTDYLALLMLPFGEEQVRAYLAANVPGADVDRLLDLIGSVHNLREIAERPLTLRMIAEQLETIEQAKLAGRTVRAVDLYGSFVRQWLERDDGKHNLIPDHKQLLMEHLAAQLWRSGRTSWDVADVEQWMLEFLAGRPELELHYPARAPGLWKEDLRTATFLVRHNDDTFGFAHTSLREYFLARYLDRALQLPREQARASWQLAVPSPETLDFLGQLLAGHDDRHMAQSRIALEAIATQPPGGRADAAAVLAFAYSLAAARAGHPDHTSAGRVLTGANLAGWRIDGGTRRLDMRGSSLAGADLTAVVMSDVDLAGADLTAATLTRAEIHGSSLRDADLQRAELVGTIFRKCDLSTVHWIGSTAHRTQALLCTQPPDPHRAGWLIAPAEIPCSTDVRLTSFTGHSGRVLGGVWSPDGLRVLTFSDDGTTRIWDPVAGEELLALTGHSGRVLGGVWSPDGLRVLTFSGDERLGIWDAVSGKELLILTGRRGRRVQGGVWSPDGSRVLTFSDDGVVRVWNAESGEDLLAVTGRGMWSPDGLRVLTVGADGTARVWDAVSGAELLIFSGHRGRVKIGAWSPDGLRVLTVGADGTARVWDAVSGAELLILVGHRSRVDGGVWSPDGLRVLTFSTDGIGRVWDAVSGAELLILDGDCGWVWNGAWSPDGLRVLTFGTYGTAGVWDAVSGSELLILSGHRGRVDGGVWSPDGSRVLTFSTDGVVRVWDAVSGAELRFLAGHIDRVSSGVWSPDGLRVLTFYDDGTVRVWDAVSGVELRFLAGHIDRVSSGVWSPDGLRVLTFYDDGTVRVWDAVSGVELRFLAGHIDRVSSGVWSPDGLRVLTFSHDRTVRVWDAVSGAELLSLNGHRGRVWGGVWSPDGSRILTFSTDGIARVWDADSGVELLPLTDHIDGVSSGVWSPDGLRVLTFSDDGTVRVWDAVSGAELRTFTGHIDGVSSGVWSPDGLRVLTFSDDESAGIWDAATGAELIVLTGHRGRAWGGVWSPDGSRVLTFSDDGTVRVWDAASGVELLVLTGHRGRVDSGGWSPDGSRVLTAGTDGTARVWDAASGRPVGWRFEQLPHGELAVWSAADGQLLGTTTEAWRWLGWQVSSEGEPVRLPAETWGPLPPLSQTPPSF